MKETSPKLTPQKKTEANKFIKYIYQNTGIKFKCRRIKDYVFLKMLYLLLINYENINESFYQPVFNKYAHYNVVKNADYFGYDLHEILKQYIVKYYYGDLTNFAVVWEYYNYLTLDDFEDRLNVAYMTIDKKMDKNIDKLNKLLDNIIINGIDYETIQNLNDLNEGKETTLTTGETIIPKFGDKYGIEWITQRDKFVCDECGDRDGKIYRHLRDVMELDRHPNCRCHTKIIKL